jgi:hypothetical protein
MARSVPSGMSPGRLGMVVYNPVAGFTQISWDPPAWRLNTKPRRFSALHNFPVAKAAETTHQALMISG